MGDENTTAAVERYLNELAAVSEDTSADAIITALLSRSVDRLRMLCASFLHRSYPRLTQPPFNLESDEVLSGVVARMMTALKSVRPQNVRQFFALASKHMRWELNDLARRLDKQAGAQQLLHESMVEAPADSSSQVSPELRRILQQIEALPEPDREAFDLVRIQGLTHGEAAELMGISVKTIQRRLSRALLRLSEALSGAMPEPPAPAGPS
jgi:RNA polymerase sigma factor (sigma-70 family)